jgi:hypothetical protein
MKGMMIAALLGMSGPLVAASATWVLMKQTYRRDPGLLTSLMVKLFAGKMVFFAAYVAVMLSLLGLRPVPFVVSFMISFIAVHVIEALSLRRLLNNS